MVPTFFYRCVRARNLFLHHDTILIGTFCYFYEAELGIMVELNLVITKKKKKKKKKVGKTEVGGQEKYDKNILNKNLKG